MLKYVSNKGGGQAVDIETAILAGYAPDGGLYVPEQLPQITAEQLAQWKTLSYQQLAFEILSLFIDRSIVSAQELKSIIETAYDTFDSEEVIPIHQFGAQQHIYIMELFHGATLSFKDVGLSFLVNLVHFFLKRKEERLSVIVATTGDTGPAAAKKGYQKETKLLDREIKALKTFTIYAGASMTFWRHQNFIYLKPDPAKFDRYLGLKILTDFIVAQDDDCFSRLLNKY